MVRCAEKGPLSRTDCGRGSVHPLLNLVSRLNPPPPVRSPALTALCSECTMQSLQTAITPRNAVSSSQQETPCCFSSFCYPPPPPSRTRGAHHPAPRRAPAFAAYTHPVSAPPCNIATLTPRSLLPCPTRPVPPTSQLPNKSKSRKVEKSASWHTPPPTSGGAPPRITFTLHHTPFRSLTPGQT